MNYHFYAKLNAGYYQHNRLPSGFDSVRFLGSRRTNPYAVHPPMFMDGDSKWKRPPVICYVPDKLMGIKILALYHEGLYFDGLEKDVIKVETMFSSLMKKVENESYEIHQKQESMISTDILPASDDQISSKNGCMQESFLHSVSGICESYPVSINTDKEIFKDSSPYSLYHPGPADTGIYNRIPLKEVYRLFTEFKYGEHASRQLSHSSRNASEAAYKKLKPFYDRSLDDISIMELQYLVDSTAAEGYSRRSTVSDLVTLIHQLYRFAFPREMCTKEYGKYIVLPYTVQEVHHQDFTDEELQILWANKENPIVSMILIMCYSGFRINEYAPENGMQTVISPDGKSGYFRGGMKTKAGKDRIVPIHSAILPLVKQTIDKSGKAVYLCGMSSNRFRSDMKCVLREIGIDGHFPNNDCKKNPAHQNISYNTAFSQSVQEIVRYHTPHSCRHTFSRLCESYGVNEADRKRMLGHSFGNDITNGVYGHRSPEELSAEIEKIKIEID